MQLCTNSSVSTYCKSFLLTAVCYAALDNQLSDVSTYCKSFFLTAVCHVALYTQNCQHLLQELPSDSSAMQLYTISSLASAAKCAPNLLACHINAFHTDCSQQLV